MPITITIPTQQQLLQMQQDPGSLLAVYNAANAARSTIGKPATAAPGVAPGSTTSSPSVVSPVPAQPTFTPTVTNVTAPAPFEWKSIGTPQINYTPQNNADWVRATADMINQINQQAQINANRSRIPMAGALESKSSQNINSALNGALPQDVLYQLGQAAAQRGVASGNQYGANTSADYLRALGLNSLQLQDTGQNWLTAALARNPSAPIYDAGKLLITPAQATQFALDQANFGLNQQQAQFGAYNANAQQNLQASLANANNATERDRLTLQSRAEELNRQNQNAQRQLQSDLANADTQFKRDQLVWQYEQNRLQRENALRIAEMEMARRGYGGGSSGYRSPTGGNVAGNFAPATNWSTGTTSTTTPWNLPQQGGGITDTEWNDMLYGYPGEDLTPSGSPPAGTYYNPNTNTSDYNPLGNYYGNGIDQGGMTQDELDWLYNVGG